MASQRRMRRFIPLSILSVFMLLGCAQGCDEKVEQDETREQEQEELPLLDPIENQPKASRCSAATQPELTLRARAEGGGEPASVEIGDGLLFPNGFSVVGLRAAGDTHALMASADSSGKQQETDLGRLFGGVDLPVLARAGQSLLVALTDNEATSIRLRLARVDSPLGSAQVTWGPSFSLTRDESFGVSLAVLGQRALVAWDDYDKASQRSRIVAAAFDVDSFELVQPPTVVSPRDVDAVEPRLTSWGAQFALAYVPLSVDPDVLDDDALIQEPDRSLAVVLLDSAGKVTQSQVAIAEKQQQVLAFDIASSPERLFLAYRSSRVGNSIDKAPVVVASLGRDGAVERGLLDHEQMGPGAPELFARPDATPILITRGEDGELLLAELGEAAQLEREPLLDDVIPLDFEQGKLLCMRPSGLDWVVAASTCSLAAQQSPESKK